MKVNDDMLYLLNYNKIQGRLSMIVDSTQHAVGDTFNRMLKAFIESDGVPQRTSFRVTPDTLPIPDDTWSLHSLDMPPSMLDADARIIGCLTDIGIDDTAFYLNFVCVTFVGNDADDEFYWVMDTKGLTREECMKFYPQGTEYSDIISDPKNHGVQFFSKEESDALNEVIRMHLALESL